MATLHLVPIHFSQALLQPLCSRLERSLRIEVLVRRPGFDPEDTLDASRGQYNSRKLLAKLLEEPVGGGRVMGVAGVDLFVPVLTYVFGEAQLDGRAAVVSSYRLDNAIYGLPLDPKLLHERLVKESVHEMGHTYGLVHCHTHKCVMRSSTYVEEIDLKDEGFCPDCRQWVDGRSG